MNNILKGVVIGIMLWVIIFIEWSIMLFVPVLKNLTLVQWIISWIVIILLGIFSAKLFYKNNDMNGFLLGLLFLAVIIILDIFITMPFFIIPQGLGYLEFFTNWQILLSDVLFILTVGMYKLKKV